MSYFYWVRQDLFAVWTIFREFPQNFRVVSVPIAPRVPAAGDILAITSVPAVFYLPALADVPCTSAEIEFLNGIFSQGFWA